MQPERTPVLTPTLSREKSLLEDKVLIRTGPFSQIYKISSPQTNSDRVLKVVTLETLLLRSVKLSIAKNNVLTHEYIVKQNLEISQNAGYVQLPLFNQDLREAIGGGTVSEMNVLFFIEDMVSILTAFAEKQLVHGNLKPSNILFKKDKKPHVSDAGYQVLYLNKFEGLAGLAIYSAPELLLTKKPSLKCDIWSLGLIVYEMLFGYPPWPNRNIQSYKSFIIKHPVSFPHDSTISENLKDFIKRCLVLDEHHRISIKKIIDHPLLSNHYLGNPTVPLKFERKGVNLLLRIQNQVLRKNRSIKRILGELQSKPFEFEKFKDACQEMNNHLTLQEVIQLFKILKANKGYTNSWYQLKKLLLQVDFRDAKCFTSRFFRELSEVTGQNSLQIQEIREYLASESQGIVTFSGFKKTVSLLLPYINQSQLQGIWSRIQLEYSNNFQAETFINQLKMGLLKKNSKSEEEKLNNDLDKFKNSFHPFGTCTVKQVIQFFDKNKDKKISFGEFREMVKSFFMNLAENDLKRMFDKIDRDHSGLISGQELKQFLKSR